MLVFHFRYPPSVNAYYTRRAAMTEDGKPVVLATLAKSVREFRDHVRKVVNRVLNYSQIVRYPSELLAVRIMLNPAQNSKTDIDNANKAVLDSLTHARLWNDDRQVKVLLNIMGENIRAGSITVTVAPLEAVRVTFEAAT